MKTLVLPIISGLALALCSISQAQAASCGNPPGPLSDQNFGTGGSVQFYQDKGTFPCAVVEQKVFLQDAQVAIGDTGYGSVGVNNNDEDMLFSSTTDILDMKNGFATIKSASEDGLINDLTIAAADGYWFTDLIVNTLNVVSTGNIWVTAYKSNGDNETYNYDTIGGGAGSGIDIMVFTDDTHFTSVNISSASGFLIDGACEDSTISSLDACGIQQIKQIEVSGYGEVPIPAAVWLFGSGLFGIVAVARRKRAPMSS